MNIFLPRIPGFIYFPAQQESRSQIPFRSIVTVNVHIIRCVALHKDSVATFSTFSTVSPFYEHGDISPKIDRIVRFQAFIRPVYQSNTLDKAQIASSIERILRSTCLNHEIRWTNRDLVFVELPFRICILQNINMYLSYSFKHSINFHLCLSISKQSRISQ